VKDSPSVTATFQKSATQTTPTVTVTGGPFTYDGTPHSAIVSAMVNGVVVAGDFIVTYNGVAALPVNAGSYAVVASFTPTDSTHYNSATANGMVTIGKALATVVVTPYSVTYDGQAHTATVTSITGVNGETGATVGTVDVSNTTHTTAGIYSSDTWSFTGAANYNNIAATTITDTISKATATVVVTPYSVTYDGHAHTATYSITGVNGETGAAVGTVNVTNTTHTNPGTFTDTWSFTGAANYNDIAAKSITDTIHYGVCSVGYGPGGVIQQPINSDGTSVYPRKGGSTIPVKFAVCDAAGIPISNAAAVFDGGTGGALTMLSAVRGTVDVINEPGISEIPDVAFRWAGDKWIFNMATSNLTASTNYTFRINLAFGFIEFRVGVK
jgi:hypothetical protein